ncbi:UNVERIFIED_CONTAM: hypothetical protein PYX00_005623 [Menopon gallinae]|uniref:Insulin-like domain-containing protein n=1 Tax=Menopon gallinae TaxID=328185 RepID=A0AAW2HTV8_9NEOP
MLALAFTRAAGLVLFYLSTGCCCLVIRYQDNAGIAERVAKPSEKTIKICGSRLTSFIMAFCDGYVSSPIEANGGNGNRNGTRASDLDHKGVAEKCCKSECDFEFLLQHCEAKSRSKKIIQSRREAANEVSYYIRESPSSTTERTDGLQTTASWVVKKVNDIPQRKNVPSFEVGTIKPDILGGDPVVVGTRSSKGAYHVSSNYINSYRSRGKSIVARY